MAAFFALQSLQAYAIFGWFAAVYRDAGFSSTTAGVLLGVITGVSMPLSFVVPALAGRMRNVRAARVALFACYPVGYLGLILAPAGGAVVWAVLIGGGTATFPLILVLIGLRARTPAGTAALSGFTQSVGYLAAAIGPFAVGVRARRHAGAGPCRCSLLLALSLPLLPVGLAVRSRRTSRTSSELAGHEHAQRVQPVVGERLALDEPVSGVERPGRGEERLGPRLQAQPPEPGCPGRAR